MRKLQRLYCLLLALLAAGPIDALDFSARVLTHQEDYVGEVAFPTSPELDLLGLGGLTATPPNPTLTGSAARIELDTTALSLDSNSTELPGAGVVGAGRLGLRGVFEGLSNGALTDGAAVLVGVSATYEPPAPGPSSIIDVFLVHFFDSAGPGLATQIAVRESDSLGAVHNFFALDLPLADEAAVLSGIPFTLDLSVDLSLPTPNAEGSILVAGSSEQSIGIPLTVLPAGGSFVAARQFGFAFSVPPLGVQVDATHFELYLDEGSDRFNIDLGSTSGTPDPSYAAAGKAGFWNALSAIGAHTLARADGSMSSATVTVGALSMSGSGPPGTDAKALLGDEAVECAAAPAIWTLEFAGLENGDYEVLLYAPASAATPTGDLFVEGVSSPALPGDPGLALIQGTSYERFHRPVTDGTLSISGQDPFFQSFCIGVAGVQLERQPTAVPALPPAALGLLLLSLLLAARWTMARS